MSVDTYPHRETTSQRDLRQAVGRQLGRTVLFCALSLVAGIAIGHFYLQKQLQVQQGLVGQLQREIRGLTGDIQRLELEGARHIARFEQTISRLEDSRRQELSGAFRGSQERLDSLQRMVERQIESAHHSEAACLAEFEAYRRRHLAVPVEDIADAVERLTAKRTEELAALLSEVEAQVDAESSRLAALEGGWLLGSDRGGRPRSGSVSLQTPVPALIPSTTIQQTPAADTSPQIAFAPPPLDLNITPSAEPIVAITPSEGAEDGEFFVVSSGAATSIEPEPETALPAPRAKIGPASRRRSYGQLISFGSGRRVDMSPASKTPAHTPPVTSAEAPSDGESR